MACDEISKGGAREDILATVSESPTALTFPAVSIKALRGLFCYDGSVSQPRKHHYIPAFYLKQWATKGVLCEMRKTNGRIIRKHKHPDGTGYKRDLYRIEGVSDEIAQHFERKFMQMVDTDASDALKTIQRVGEWSIRERDGWIRFLLSLLFRNPEAVETVKAQIREIWRVSIAAFEENYEAKRGPDDPPTFEEFKALTSPDAPEIAASNFLQTIMNGPNTGPAIAKMQWGKIYLKNSKFTLLTSDRPLDMPKALSNPEAYIALPIGPRLIFVATNNLKLIETLRRTDHTKMARSLNLKVVAQAREYVWGLDDSQAGFVERHIGKMPDRQLISDRGRTSTLLAATGQS